MATVVPFRAFVSRHALRFDLERVLEESVLAWAGGRRVPEGYEDAVVAALDYEGLRLFSEDANEAEFHRGTSEHKYRRCVVAALQRLAHESSRPRTAEDTANYNRPCAE